VYYNPIEIKAFEEDPRWQVRHFREVPDLLFDAAYIALLPAVLDRPTSGAAP
jgi:hypothetical protein